MARVSKLAFLRKLYEQMPMALAEDVAVQVASCLEARDELTCIKALDVLGEAGSSAAPAIPLLEQALASRRPWVRIGSASLLLKLNGSTAAQAAIVEYLAEEAWEFELLLPAIAALRHAPRLVPEATTRLIFLLRCLAYDAAVEAADTLRHFDTPHTVRELMRCLSADKPYVRLHAAAILLTFKADARPAIPALLTALADADRQLSSMSAGALSWIGLHASDTERAGIVAALRDSIRSARSQRQREDLAGSLLRLVPGDDQALDIMLAAAAHGNRERRSSALFALRFCGPHAEKVIPLLVEALGDCQSDAIVQSLADTAAQSLGQIGAPGVPALIDCLESDQLIAHAAAAFALEDIGLAAGAAVPAILARLERLSEYAQLPKSLGIGDDKMFAYFVHALACTCQRNEGRTAHWLARGLEWDNDLIRGHCLDALARIGHHAPAVVARAEQLLGDNDCRAIHDQARAYLQSTHRSP